MQEKKELYFARRGAQEFWICQEDGGMRFYNNHAQLESSQLALNFPTRVKLPFA